MTKCFNRTAANEDPPFVKTVRVSEDFTSSPAVPAVPAGHLRDNRQGLDNIYLGPSLYGDLWVALQRLMNFNFTMVDLSVLAHNTTTVFIHHQVYSIDGSWGSLNDDGSWNGVVIRFIKT